MYARASDPAKEKRPVQRGEGKVRSSGCCAFLTVLRPSPRGEGVSSYLVCPAIHPPCTPARICDSGRAFLWEGDLHWVDGEWMRGASRGLEALLCWKFVPARRRRKRAPDDDPVSVESYTHEPPLRATTWVALSLSPENLPPSFMGRLRIARVPTYLRLPAEGGELAGFLTTIFKVPPRCHHPPRPSPSTDISRETYERSSASRKFKKKSETWHNFILNNII